MIKIKDCLFQDKLKKMLDDGVEDEEIIKYVLNHAMSQWTGSLVYWVFTELKGYCDNFV